MFLCDERRDLKKKRYEAERAKEYREALLIVVVYLLFYVHGKHLRSCRDGQLT